MNPDDIRTLFSVTRLNLFQLLTECNYAKRPLELESENKEENFKRLFPFL